MRSAQRSYFPERVTACTIVYIPERSGFFEHSLEVLKACLTSMRATTAVPFDLFVLDNGSCAEVRDYLHDLYSVGYIQGLFLSASNMGKGGAWNVLLPACPGEYIAYCDSDIGFRVGWLEDSLRIFQAFPSVGTVTARPFRTPSSRVDHVLSSTLEYAASAIDINVARGDLLDRTVLEEHLEDAGQDPNALNAYDDIRLSVDNVVAYAYSAHYQFLVPRATALRVLPIEHRDAMTKTERIWDERINQLGLLRLSTNRPLVRHLANSLPPDEDFASDEVAQADSEKGQDAVAGHTRTHISVVTQVLRKVAKRRLGRLILRKAYLALFKGLQSDS